MDCWFDKKYNGTIIPSMIFETLTRLVESRVYRYPDKRSRKHWTSPTDELKSVLSIRHLQVSFGHLMNGMAILHMKASRKP